ncbi:MAG: hypothetical protein K2X91_09400, partial [Thermoleophilia bacterium]|nr:hypothetical protein [Thermoleophilia bacterium]
LPGAPALAALFRLTGAPSGLLVYTDRPTGVVALLGAAGAAAGESPTLLVRILKDDATDADAFDAVRDEAVADANDALAFQTPVPLLQVGEALRFPRRPQVAGLSGDDRISEFALALGAAAFALDARPDELPLLAMSDRSPTAGRTLVARVRESFSTPRALAVTAVACLSLLLTGWILAAPARLAILQKRVGDDTGDYTKAVQQHDWYHALHERRWPMTALMAELTATAPEGVRVESLTIEQGRPITLAGSAPTSEDVYAWCKSLRGRVFSEVVPTIPQEDASPVRFTLRADVADALAAAAGDLKPIAASDTPHPHADQPRSDRAERPDRPGRSTTPRPVPTQGRSTTTRSGTSTSPASAGAPSAEVPPAMTEAQIDKLAIGPATIEWARRKGQLARSDLEPTVRARLQHELQHLEARRKALGGGQ